MNRKFRYHFSKLIFPIFCLFLLLYFSYHILSGNYGWFAWQRLKKEQTTEQTAFETLSQEKEQLENKVNLLRPDHVDKDMLEERIRATSSHVEEGDVVIIDRRLS